MVEEEEEDEDEEEVMLLKRTEFNWPTPKVVRLVTCEEALVGLSRKTWKHFSLVGMLA